MGRGGWRPSSPTPSSELCWLQQATPGCSQLGFEGLHGWTLHKLSGQHLPWFDHSHHKTFSFSCVPAKFPVVQIIPAHPSTDHQEAGSVDLALSHRVLGVSFFGADPVRTGGSGSVIFVLR